MRNLPKSVRRQKRGFRKEKTVVRLHVEGKITEREYFQCIRSPDIYLDFAQSAGLDPKSLVRNARRELRQQKHQASNGDFDQLWCVFDVDQHERLAEALSDAQNSEVNIAVSNPCFELWLVLHIQDQHAFISTTEIQRLCQRLGLVEGKHLSADACERLKESTLEAKNRAIDLCNSHVATGSDELANPSSTVWSLVDRLQNVSSA